jgi:alanine dehydrogenase
MGLIIGIPKETSPYEYRVGMTPAGVSILTEMGHQCYVESGAGDGSGFSDTAFEQAARASPTTMRKPSAGPICCSRCCVPVMPRSTR